MSEEDRMVKDNIRLIHLVMKDHNLLYMKDELYDIGLIGLTKGIKTFDKSLGYRESTYMYTCIKTEIVGYLRKLNTQKRTLFKEVSLNTKIKTSKTDGEGIELMDTIADERVDFEENVEIEERNELLERYVCRLSSGQRELICHYYGILGYNRMTVSELKKKYDTSKQAIFARRNRALEKLKAMYEKDLQDEGGAN